MASDAQLRIPARLAKLIMPSKALGGTIVKMLVGIAGRSGRGALVPKRIVQRAVAQGDAARTFCSGSDVTVYVECCRGGCVQRQ